MVPLQKPFISPLSSWKGMDWEALPRMKKDCTDCATLLHTREALTEYTPSTEILPFPPVIAWGMDVSVEKLLKDFFFLFKEFSLNYLVLFATCILQKISGPAPDLVLL